MKILQCRFLMTAKGLLIVASLLLTTTPLTMTVNAHELTPSAVSEVYFIYEKWYNTRDYECWGTDGKSTNWQGTSHLGGYDTVHNAGVVRQGTVIHVNGTGASISTIVTVKGPTSYSGIRVTETGWHPKYVAGEQWELTVPPDAPIGDYQVWMDSSYATLYVVFNIMKWKGDFTTSQWQTWGYTETSSVEEYAWLGDYPPGTFGTGRPYSQRVTEFICSVMGSNVNRETDALLVACMMAQKRIIYGTVGMTEQDFNGENILNGNMTVPGNPLPVNEARLVAAYAASALPSTYVLTASCSHYTTLTLGLVKSLGLVARTVFDSSGTWGWFYHHWLEVYVPDVGFSVNGTFNGWLTIDNTRQMHKMGSDAQYNGAPALDTQQDYSFASYAFSNDMRPGDAPGGVLYTFRYSGSGTEEDSSNWIADSILEEYFQIDQTNAQTNLPTLGNGDIYTGTLSEGDREFFRIHCVGASAVSLTFVHGWQNAQLFVRKDATVSMSPLGSRVKSAYVYDNWADNNISVTVSGTTYLYVMVDNAKGAKFADDYTDGEIQMFQISISITGAPLPTVPGNPMYLMAHGAGDSIFLTWRMPVTSGGSPITGYKIFRGTTSGGEGPIPIATPAASDLSYVDYPAVSGRYYYIIKAVNSVGDSLPSNEASANTTIDSSVPEIETVIQFIISATLGLVLVFAVFRVKRDD